MSEVFSELPRFPCADLTLEQIDRIFDIYDHTVGNPDGDLEGALRSFGIDDPLDHEAVRDRLDEEWRFATYNRDELKQLARSFPDKPLLAKLFREARVRSLRGEIELSVFGLKEMLERASK